MNERQVDRILEISSNDLINRSRSSWKMTRSEATNKMKTALRRGHYKDGNTVYVKCPDCGEKVWDDKLKNLKDTLVLHFLIDCGEEVLGR